MRCARRACSLGRRRSLAISASLTLALAGVVLPAGADEPCMLVSRANVAACAISASPAVLAEREGVSAAAGRRTAADPWFPSNPALSFTAGRRTSDTDPDGIKTTASLAQEIEIAGQRSS